jgi:hypothetical protein
MGYYLVSGGNLLWVIMWWVFGICYGVLCGEKWGFVVCYCVVNNKFLWGVVL